MDTVFETIRTHIESQPVVLFMKGTPDMPQCGFSAKVVQILHACNAPFHSVDVLANPDIRKALPEYAKWPTFPQLYVRGELVGGCDIVVEMYTSKELQTLLASSQ